MKHYFTARFHNDKIASFGGFIETHEVNKQKIIELCKKERDRKYGEFFYIRQDLSYFDVVSENGNVLFEWERKL